MWKSFNDKFYIKNLISFCDFGPHSIARNIIFAKSGTKTWYYDHSSNFHNFFLSDKNRDAFPFYNHLFGFLFYDYYLSWSNELIRYLKIHKQDIKEYINIGCLWSGHIKAIEKGKIRSDLLHILRKHNFKDEYKLISVFDSTYIDYSITTYEDGINFLKGIYHLLKDLPFAFILLKEKRPRFCIRRDSKAMLRWFEKLESHPRCYLSLLNLSPSEAIALSDLTVSFPFSSTTFEALSAKKKALFFDSSDKLRGTFYDQVPGLVCHDYEELLNRTKQLLFDIDDTTYCEYLDKFVKGRLESYLDGKAIKRFQQLLSAERPVEIAV